MVGMVVMSYDHYTQGGSRVSTDPLRDRNMESTVTDRIDTTVMDGPGRRTPVLARSDVDLDLQIPLRDRVRWGAIIAGVVSAFAVLLFLTTIGIALGLSALGGDSDTSGWGTTAGIFGAITLLLAFFVGGWVAARSAAPSPESNGVFNGFLTGAALLLLLLWLATSAITGALGFFAGTVGDIATAASNVAPAVTDAVDPNAVGEVAPAVEDAVENPDAAVTEVTEQVDEVIPDDPGAVAAEVASADVAPGAWGTAIAMLLAVIAAALGGLVGQNQERDRVPGSRGNSSS
jgi:hypothetical protein